MINSIGSGKHSAPNRKSIPLKKIQILGHFTLSSISLGLWQSAII